MYVPSLIPAGALPEKKISTLKFPDHWEFRRLDFKNGEAYSNMRAVLKIQEAEFWWVWVDLNHRPHPYQGCALTN